jgi:hypothetical protein
MRFQAMKQPLQRQPLLRTSRPFHTTRTMLRVKASLRSLVCDVSGLTISLQEDEHSGKYPRRARTNILMPIHSTHSHRASEDTEEDPTRAVATRGCHCVRDMAPLSDNTLTPLPGSPFLRPVLLWARSCSRTRPFAFTNLARTIRDLNRRMQRAERRLVRQENWPEAVVEHVKLSFADGGIIS